MLIPTVSHVASSAPAQIRNSIDETVRAVGSLLGALERNPTGPATGAYRSALARHGRNLLDTAGREALAAARERIATADPDRADERLAALDAAWAGLTGRQG